jgi:hypothetical protein
LCGGDKLAEHFSNDLNNVPIRDLRLVCCRCAAGFNKMPLDTRRRFLQEKINKFYGEKQFVYALCEPKTEIIRYIGRTVNPQARYNNHLQLTREFAKQTCLFTGTAKFSCTCLQHKLWNKRLDTKRWITKLLAKDRKPVMKILEEVTAGRLIHEREVRYICQFIKEGYKLLNYENQSRNVCRLVKEQSFSFLDVDIDELSESGFLRECEFHLSLDVSHESGWRRAFLLHQVYSTDSDLIFDELILNSDV